MLVPHKDAIKSSMEEAIESFYVAYLMDPNSNEANLHSEREDQAEKWIKEQKPSPLSAIYSRIQGSS